MNIHSTYRAAGITNRYYRNKDDQKHKIRAEILNEFLPERERERDTRLFIALVPKVKSRFLIRWLNNFGDLSEFCLVDSLSWVTKRFNLKFLSTEEVIMFIIFVDVHQFIGHCLIPLDPWMFLLPGRPTENCQRSSDISKLSCRLQHISTPVF